MEHGTHNPELSRPQSAYTRAYAAAEPGFHENAVPAISQVHNHWSSVSTSFVNQQLGDFNSLSRSGLAENNRISHVDYGPYNTYDSVATLGNFTRADPWAPSSPNDHAFGPPISSNTLQLTGSTFPAGFAAGAPDNDGTGLPTAPIPYAWGATASTIYSNNNTLAPSVNSNPSPLTGSTFAANAAYSEDIMHTTAPIPFALEPAASPGSMNHYMAPGFHYSDAALPMMDPFAADTNGEAYHGQFPATSFNTQLGAAIEPQTASHATHNSDTAPFDLAQLAPQPPPTPRPTCPTCNHSFGRQADLDRHAKKHRTDARVYRCGCGYSSYRKDKLDEHVRRSGHRAAAGGASANGF